MPPEFLEAAEVRGAELGALEIVGSEEPFETETRDDRAAHAAQRRKVEMITVVVGQERCVDRWQLCYVERGRHPWL